MTNIEVICIDDSHRPEGIPADRWVKAGEKYHIVEIAKMTDQEEKYGCKLAEINIDDLIPHDFFRLKRFAISLGIFEDEEMLEPIDISTLKEKIIPGKKNAE